MCDRFEGCLLGAAVGDALGMPVEGWLARAIPKAFGRVDRFLDEPGLGLRAGQWTDDTHMSLAIVDSLLERRTVDPADIARRFLAWFRSGDWRGIGGTTYAALARIDQGAPWDRAGESGEFSAGNGAAMRAAPIGLWHARRIEGLRQDVWAASVITHAHPEAIAGAAAVALGVTRALAGADPAAILREAAAFVEPSVTAAALGEAAALLGRNTPPADALAAIGTTGYAVHTAAGALYLLARFGADFRGAVVEAVMAGGDTDTLASITGALVGALAGVEAIPAEWRDGVEAGASIRDRARRLFEIVQAQSLTPRQH